MFVIPKLGAIYNYRAVDGTYWVDKLRCVFLDRDYVSLSEITLIGSKTIPILIRPNERN